MTTTTTILVITGSAILAGVAIALIMRMRARCPKCGSHKVLESVPGELRCVECGTAWYE